MRSAVASGALPGVEIHFAKNAMAAPLLKASARVRTDCVCKVKGVRKALSDPLKLRPEGPVLHASRNTRSSMRTSELASGHATVTSLAVGGGRRNRMPTTNGDD